MRRLLVVLALLALMVGVKSLQAAPGEGASDPLTLATIGFVLLAAFTLAESGAVLRLPRVTGYIVGGALLGPSVSNLLHQGVVSEMRMFNTLALGLIALSAGLELDVRQIAKVWRTLIATIAFKMVFLSVLVGGGLVLFERFFPSLGLASQQHVYALALVFFALAIGTSPSITLALLSELRAKGRAADLFLGAAVLKDLVVVVTLALAVALARPLLGGEAVGHGGLGAVAVELGASMLAGVILGGLLVAYVRFVNAEMLLFVAAMILVVSELSRALHLELLLVFIAAGFVVRNFTKYEHQLMGPVSLVALPVFVVFFTNAGASIDIARTLRLLPIALALSVLRAVGLWGAAGLGARVGGEGEPIRRYSWLGYVPQAGVTLGLVAIAARQLPTLAESIAGLGMAVVAINLLLGPLTLRLALTKLGGGPAPADLESEGTPGMLQASLEPGASAAVGIETGMEAELRRWSGELSPPELRDAIRSLCLDVLEVGATHRRALAAQAQGYVQALREAIAAGRSEPGLADAERRMAALAWLPVQALGQLSGTAFRQLRDRMRALPSELLDPVQPAQLHTRRGDSLWMELRRWRRRSALLFSKRARMRHIPLQMAARVALERRLAGWASQQLVDYARLRAVLTATLERYLRDELSGSEAIADAQRLLDGWPMAVENDLRVALQAGVLELVSTCLEADLPGADPKRARLSLHDRQIADQLSALERDPPLWQRILDILGGTLLLEFHLAQAQVTFKDALSVEASGPAERALSRLDGVLAGVSQELTRLAVQLTTDAESSPAVAADWRRYLSQEHGHLEEDVAALHAASVLQRLGLELRRVVGRLPDRAEVLRPPLEPGQLTEPASVRFRTLDPRAIADEQLMDRLLPRIEEHLESVAAGMDAALETLHGIEAMSSHAIEAREPVVLERAARQASSARANLSALQQQSVVALHTDSEQAFSTVAALLSHRVAGSMHEEATTVLSRSALAIRRVTSQSWVRLQASASKLVSSLTRLGEFELARRFRGRSSRAALDGESMATLIESVREPPQLPADYAKLFAARPVREPRLFCAREQELRAVLDAEGRSVDGMPGSVLIVGAHGSGRTSMLNVAQLELRAPRVLRPQPGQAQRRGELLRALAIELDCRSDARAVSDALVQSHTTVLVDDLEHWFEPTLIGAARLDEFVRLVSTTRAAVCFVVALSNGAFQILRELVPLEAAFTRLVRLPPLGAVDLQRVIEGRHRLSGMPLEFQSEFGLRRLRHLGSDREGPLYFRLLRRMTSGNLALALRVFLASASVTAGQVRVRTEHPLSIDLPFLGELHTQQLAALNQALRFGGVDEHSLQGAGEVRSGVEVHLAFLRTIGLLIAEGPRRGLLTIPADLRPIVEQALAQRGAGSVGEA